MTRQESWTVLAVTWNPEQAKCDEIDEFSVDRQNRVLWRDVNWDLNLWPTEGWRDSYHYENDIKLAEDERKRRNWCDVFIKIPNDGNYNSHVDELSVVLTSSNGCCEPRMVNSIYQ